MAPRFERTIASQIETLILLHRRSFSRFFLTLYSNMSMYLAYKFRQQQPVFYNLFRAVTYAMTDKKRMVLT